MTDQTGAVVPKATVTATNTATGLTRQVVADESGYYSIPNLLEGTYDLSVSSQGFRPYASKGVIVSVNKVTREHTSKLEVLSLYWHFVDSVWVFVFTLVYVVGR